MWATDWQWDIAEGVNMLCDLFRDAAKWLWKVEFLFGQGKNAIGFPCRCLTVRKANE